MTLLRLRRRAHGLAALARARLWGLLYRGVDVGRRVRIGRGCRLILEPGARLVLADRCTIDDASTLAIYGSGRISLGAGCFVGHHATLAAHRLIELGDGAYLAELVSVRDHDHAVGVPPSRGAVEVAPVSIGSDSWLGAKVTVLRGARIGADSVVGANAVVSGEVPPRTLAAGIPARTVRALDAAP